jgi:RNA polymerase sigma factor (sigma-70 family)
MAEDFTDILERAKAGELVAENRLFDDLLARFELFAARRFGRDAAKDIAQEACITVLRKYRTETFTVGFEAWAYGVLKNTIRNYARETKTRDRVITPDPEIEREGGLDSEPEAELKLTLLDCLKRIFQTNPRYARVLNLVHQGFKAAEISERLDITPNHFYVILNRGRSLLKLCLETGRV